jgi:hypothetical protein
MNRKYVNRAILIAGGFVTVTGAFAQVTVSRPKPITITGGAPTAPRVVPSVPPPADTGGAVAMPKNPVGNGPLQVNKRQAKVTGLDLVRPTPAVAMVVARDTKQHAEFAESRIIPVVRNPAVTPPALPLKLGSSGAALKKGQTVIVENDGRNVSSGVYAQDTFMLEDYLNTRGTTQRTRENVHKVRQMRRQIASSRLPKADANTLRPSTNAKQTPVELNNLRVAPLARAKTVAEARAGLWESGETVTLDRYKSKDEVRKSPPLKPVEPARTPSEILRPDGLTSWFYKSGGEVGLDIDSDVLYGTGPARRMAGANMKIQAHAAGLDIPLISTAAKIESVVAHVYNAETKQFSAGKPAQPMTFGELQILGIADLPQIKGGLTQPKDWSKEDSYSMSAAVPVGPLMAEFKLTMGYRIGGTATLTPDPADGGLGVTAQVGPEFGAYVELTAGIGIVGFSVGVGGHVALLGNQDGSGPASLTRNAFSRYEENGWKQAMGGGINSNIWALSGNLFAFVDTWWERYDTEIFDWEGIKLGAGDMSTGAVNIVWGTMQEPDYGPLQELRAFACKQNGVDPSRIDWTPTTRSQADMLASGCQLGAAPNDVLIGKLASKWNPDTYPVVECRMDTSARVMMGNVLSAPATPINGPFIRNDYLMAVMNDWRDAPSAQNVLTEGQAACDANRIGAGQRSSMIRLAGYGWKQTQGEALLDAKTRKTAKLVASKRCTGGFFDWWTQLAGKCPALDASYTHRKRNPETKKLDAMNLDFGLAE